MTSRETAGSTYVNGVSVQYGDEEPVRTYTVTVPRQNDINPLYYAEVNAVTGFAYRAEKSDSLLSSMTAEQQKRAEALTKIDPSDDTSDRSMSSALVAWRSCTSTRRQ